MNQPDIILTAAGAQMDMRTQLSTPKISPQAVLQVRNSLRALEKYLNEKSAEFEDVITTISISSCPMEDIDMHFVDTKEQFRKFRLERLNKRRKK
jgi:hypothetical protein